MTCYEHHTFFCPGNLLYFYRKCNIGLFLFFLFPVISYYIFGYFSLSPSLSSYCFSLKTNVVLFLPNVVAHSLIKKMILVLSLFIPRQAHFFLGGFSFDWLYLSFFIAVWRGFAVLGCQTEGVLAGACLRVVFLCVFECAFSF